MDDKARELYVKDPVPQLTILAGQLVKRVEALEEQTKFLVSQHYTETRDETDFEFAIKYGTIDDVVRSIQKGYVGFGDIRPRLPLIRQRKDADALIAKLRQYDSKLKGGKTYRRKLKGLKHTRKQ